MTKNCNGLTQRQSHFVNLSSKDVLFFAENWNLNVEAV